MSRIGYKKIKVDGAWYVYDTSTNATVSLPGEAPLLLDDYLELGRQELRAKYAGRLSRRDFADASAFLDRAVEEAGMFQPFFRKDYTGVLDRKCIRSKLSGKLTDLVLEVTEQCNQRCTYCVYSGNYAGERTHRSRHMTWSVAKKAIDFFLPRMDDREGTRVSLYGGEPLARWDLVQRCVGYVRGQSICESAATSISTNLTLLTEEMADFVAENEVHLVVSLDGPKHIHDEARVSAQGGGTYATVMKNLRMLRDRSPEYFRSHVAYLITFNTNNDLAEVFEFFDDELFDGLAGRINEVRFTDTDFYAISPANIEKQKRAGILLTKRYLDSLSSDYRGRFNYLLFRQGLPIVFLRLPRRDVGHAPRATHPNQTCTPGMHRVFVDREGNFHPCERLEHNGIEIGHLDTGFDIEKIRGMLELYAEFCEETCQECWAYRLCGHCLVHFLGNGELRQERKLEHCERERKAIEIGLERFIHIWNNEPPGAAENPLTLHGLQKTQDQADACASHQQNEAGGATARIEIRDLPDDAAALGTAR